MNREKPSRPKRFWQFTLRQLLILSAVLALFLGILVPQLRGPYRQRQIVRVNRRATELRADLIEAVRKNDLVLARRALEAGADPNAYSGPGPVLHDCLQKGQVEMMELLLEFGADPDGPRPSERVPLLDAVTGHQPAKVRIAMIRLLAKYGAPMQGEGEINAMDLAAGQGDAELGDVLREYGLPYGPREMAAFNRLDELKRAIGDNPDIISQPCRPFFWVDPKRPGPTLLGIALRRGYREMAIFLLDSGAPLDCIEDYDGYGGTLVHLAAQGGDPELIRVLAARGLDVNARDKYQTTPLLEIVQRGKPEAIAALIEVGADVNAQSMFEYTPLLIATQENRVEIVRMLLAAGADPTNPGKDGQTALDIARKQSPEILKLLEEAVAAKQPTDGPAPRHN